VRAAGIRGICTVAAKELTQLANRKAMHFEKVLFVAVTAAIFLFSAYSVSAISISPQQMAGFGRQVFYRVAGPSCMILSLFSLLTASGIIMSEKTGKRLDILRITPLSLPTIVLGKGAAIFLKTLLVLAIISPVLAAANFYGGVASDEFLKAAVITLSNITLCLGIGLYVSSGARTTLDRVARSAEWMFVWLVVFGWIIYGVTLRPIGPLHPYIASFSPFASWRDLQGAVMPWRALAVGSGMTGLVGIALALRSAKKLHAAVANEDNAPAEPKISNFIASFRSRSHGGGKVRQKEKKRDWAGTLVGCELNHTSMLSVLLPLAVGVPPLVVAAFGRLGGRRSFESSETTLIIAAFMLSVLSIIIALQGCACVAKEKKRGTAEVLSTTPAGGRNMLGWKASAICLSQSLAIIICLVLVMGASGIRRSPFDSHPARVVCALSLLCFALCVGVAFSHSCRSPFVAASLLAGSVIIGNSFVFRLLRDELPRQMSKESYYSQGLPVHHAFVVAAVGICLVAVRWIFGRGASFMMSVGLSLSLGAGAIAAGMLSGRFTRYTAPWPLELMLYALRTRDFNPQTALAVSGFLFVLSAVLVGGALPRFTRIFLHGAKAGE